MKQPKTLPIKKTAPLAVGLRRLVRGQHVNIWNSGTTALEEKHGFTKHGHGRHYISVGEPYAREYVDKAWDRRCDASRWAKRAGAKTIKHWYLF
jgi:hypothetical protein